MIDVHATRYERVYVVLCNKSIITAKSLRYQNRHEKINRRRPARRHQGLNGEKTTRSGRVKDHCAGKRIVSFFSLCSIVRSIRLQLSFLNFRLGLSHPHNSWPRDRRRLWSSTLNVVRISEVKPKVYEIGFSHQLEDEALASKLKLSSAWDGMLTKIQFLLTNIFGI